MVGDLPLLIVTTVGAPRDHIARTGRVHHFLAGHIFDGVDTVGDGASGIDLFNDPQLVVGNRRGSWSAVIVAATIIARKRAEIYIAGRGGGGAGGGIAPTGSPSGRYGL